MKTLSTLFTTLALLATFSLHTASAQNLEYQFPCPEGFSHTENWLNTWKNFSENNQASRWLMEQTADASSQLFVEAGGKSIIILQAAHWANDLDLAAEIGEGPEVPALALKNMTAENQAQSLAQGVILSEWNVEIENTPARVYMAGFRLQDGTGMRVLILNQPGQGTDFNPESGAEGALAMIHDIAENMEPTLALK